MTVTNEQFLSELTKLFEESSSKHSVYVSSKKAPASAAKDDDVDMIPSSARGLTDAILFRATNGVSGSGKIKISTLVPASKLASFQKAYLPLLRTHLSNGLKKRDKAKERKMDKAREQSRKKMIETVLGKDKIMTNKIGSKRGAGRRKRQRALKKGLVLRKEKVKEVKRKLQVAKTA
ncbi:related to Signal recognition particle 14 kDa protein [Melanopsichium pennsylvanicum]|uniref:Signal recognition particle subunit SRP14 n=2 Tax=Melanopsichium pennsylvanicum TaxID=63383 RepID=A0AAJ5C721_9BASI|nr:related to Signal recognition particle 14 kDa protein [Melanopsichium pennsylvanicum 4]SNX86462.1 related to Signal recognition particle 14 kDa protein [Melanopsichium pennsylvanicum]